MSIPIAEGARDRSHDDAMAEFFQSDPAYAAFLLAEIAEDKQPDELRILVRQLAKAHLSELESAGRTMLEILDSANDGPPMPGDEFE